MDDVCESLTTVSTATKRIEEVDEILNNGHFKIKEWFSNKRINAKQSQQTNGCQMRRFWDWYGIEKWTEYQSL
jgi:hypothetical protein